MSAGDIDDKVEPPMVFHNAMRNNASFHAYIERAWRLKPVRSFFIPWGAGISDDGETVYISYDIQTVVDGVECENALVRHETTEWALRHFLGIGDDYSADPSGHRIANGIEFDRVRALLGYDNIDIYREVIDEQVLRDERIDFSGKPIPRDLALYPYESDDDVRARIMGEMFNDRSVEEWEKLHPTFSFRQDESDLPDDRLTRDCFLYLDPKPPNNQFAQCNTCRDWIVNDRCYIHRPDDEVPGSASCGLYVHGSPLKDGTPIGAVTPEQSGLVDREVRCENCHWGGPGNYTCALYELLNHLMPSTFNLDERIDPYGCCNAQKPRDNFNR